MNLDNLKPRIDQFIDFVRKFPAAYRPAIMRYLLQVDATERGAAMQTYGATAKVDGQGAAIPVSPGSSTGHIHPAVIEIAKEIGVAAEIVNRLVTIVEGRPEISRYRSEDVSRARRQIEYSIVYTYAMEKLGEEGARITELRNLCTQKRSYDMANFMANFKRQHYLLQLANVPGRKDQEIVLTGRGRQRARELLGRAAENLPDIAPVGLAVQRDSGLNSGSEAEQLNPEMEEAEEVS